MAVTATNSAQYDAQTLPNSELDHPNHGRVKAFAFEFTQGAAAGDPGSTANLIKLPAGKMRLLTGLSRLETSAFGAGRTLSVGYPAYNTLDGTAVAASANAFVNAADVSAATTSSTSLGLDQAGLPRGQYIETRDGLVIRATVAGGTIPAGATIRGVIYFIAA